MGDYVGECVAGATADMAKVQRAANAITDQYNSTKSLMNSETCAGGSADQDMGQWNSQCRQVLALLSGLPAKEQEIITQTQTQAQAALKKNPTLSRVVL